MGDYPHLGVEGQTRKIGQARQNTVEDRQDVTNRSPKERAVVFALQSVQSFGHLMRFCFIMEKRSIVK